MSGLTLYGRLNSVNVQKAVWALHEAGQTFERIDAGSTFGVNNTPDYRAMNPNGLVPTLRDGEFVLWESNAIVRYLLTKHCRGTLAPVDAQHFADADRWLDWQQLSFNAFLGPAFHGLVRSPGARSPAEIEGSRVGAEAAMAILDAHLSGRDWLAGPHCTMADGVVGASAHRWLHMPIRREPRPAVEAWYARLMQRPAAQQAFVLPLT